MGTETLVAIPYSSGKLLPLLVDRREGDTPELSSNPLFIGKAFATLAWAVRRMAAPS